MEEIYRADAPDFFWQGTHMLAPVLIAFGSAQLKSRFLPKILTGEESWCQGFSEPGAGSDLANLRTAATLEDGHYIINGQKIWTSDARESDWGFFLVRTDPTVKPAARAVLHRDQDGRTRIRVRPSAPSMGAGS